MTFELAYDLELAVDNEVVFVMQGDAHRKVRVLLTEVDDKGDQIAISGNSVGSSFKEIKSAKRDEPPVRVKGTFTRSGDTLSGELQMAD